MVDAASRGRIVKWSIVLVVLLYGVLRGQSFEILDPSVVGFRTSGPMKGGVPVLLTGQALRITLDAIEKTPRDLRVHIVHCDRNWTPTASEFVNDPFLIAGKKPIASSPSAAGVSAYGRSYGTSIPSGAGLEPFRFSGNYRASVVDEETGKELVVFNFSVAEKILPGKISIDRRRLPMKISPWDQAHAVTVVVGEDALGGSDEPAYLQLVRVVEIYKNREWETPYRVDLDALTSSAWVDGLGTSTIRFVAGAVMPGNEYRSLDIRSVDVYPPGGVLKARDGADVSRFFAQGTAGDQNGSSTIISAKEYANYELFEFQLWWEAGDASLPVYIVGDFNGWTRRPEWKLFPGREEGRFALRHLLKRGRYDYAYVQGNDAIALEGNSWETRNLYTALVYYGDLRLGGYDRILFVSQVEGNGTSSGSKGK